MIDDYLGVLVSLEPIHSIIGEMYNSKETIKEFKTMNVLSSSKKM